MSEDFVDNFFEVHHFMERCLEFKRQMEAVMAPYTEVYEDMQRKAKQPKITSFFTKSSVSPPSCFLCRSINLTTFSQERLRRPNKHLH
jgi:hypothetical protein